MSNNPRTVESEPRDRPEGLRRNSEPPPDDDDLGRHSRFAAGWWIIPLAVASIALWATLAWLMHAVLAAGPAGPSAVRAAAGAFPGEVGAGSPSGNARGMT